MVKKECTQSLIRSSEAKGGKGEATVAVTVTAGTEGEEEEEEEEGVVDFFPFDSRLLLCFKYSNMTSDDQALHASHQKLSEHCMSLQLIQRVCLSYLTLLI